MEQVFKYLDQLDCFIVDPEFKKIADNLGLTEWSEVVWIGRYFLLDNDFGEHWFDNWDLREDIEDQAKLLGLDSHDLFIIDPKIFRNDLDGPCHTDLERKRFWTDVLKSLKISYETIFSEARKENEKRETEDEEYIINLDQRIESLKALFC